jgi:hypothetical protein
MRAVFYIACFMMVTTSAFAEERCSLETLIGSTELQYPLPGFPKIPKEDLKLMKYVSLYEPLIVADADGYSALVDAGKSEAWIHRYGGYFGVSEWYGPVAINRTLAERCIKFNSPINSDGRSRPSS